jgi:hypothetical protein
MLSCEASDVLFFLPKSWSKPLSTALEANTLTIAQSKWFDQINKTDVYLSYEIFKYNTVISILM